MGATISISMHVSAAKLAFLPYSESVVTHMRQQMLCYNTKVANIALCLQSAMPSHK